MSSSWGNSWGSSWGDSWGVIVNAFDTVIKLKSQALSKVALKSKLAGSVKIKSAVR